LAIQRGHETQNKRNVPKVIPYGRQFIDKEDIKAVVSALKGELITTGPLVDEFERQLSEKVKTPTFVVNSGTSALHCAYYGIGIEPGDEVITPPNTFVATQATAIHLGAKIVFADIDLHNGLISVNEIAKKITKKTKAIVLVDYAGQPCDIDAVRKLISGTNIKIIQDAAHSLGSLYKGEPVGSLADVTTFSFFPTKNITTGEGGAVASQGEEIFMRAKEFGRQGLIRDSKRFIERDDGPWHQEVHKFGLNYRLNDIQCALGISQLKKLDNYKKKRSQIFELYSKEFSLREDIKVIQYSKDVDPMWHLFPVRVPSNKKLEMFSKLRSQAIGVQVNYLPAYWHPAFKALGFEKGLCPNSEEFYKQEISLPMHVGLKKKEILKISKTLTEFLN
jgi:dTDP-4-amino-4,6-dideoxygalactose transaminase